ncbi:VirK/YbjX family protein [Enterobacter cloacae]|uniref:VirK/YbjX family protein n=1 Tax=Enterobacter cloacae TaxID=550 RepID=UPI001EF81897|nr:VirK/YbjX family protein [Enterobacter cloacae]
MNTLTLFYQLVCAKNVPDKMWLTSSFRAKFLLRSLVFPVTTFRYLHHLSELPCMSQALRRQGLLPAKIHRPYLCSGFSVSQRAKAVIAHYNFVNQLKHTRMQELFLSDVDVLLCSFDGKNDEKFTIKFCTGYYDREGEVTLLLLMDDVRLGTLSFTIIERDGVPAFLIGGLQGAKKVTGNDFIRKATKACFGLFPKKILMETLLTIAMQCSVRRIMAVGDNTHVFHSLRYRLSKRNCFHASYDEFWSSISGSCTHDGLYTLTFSLSRKPLEEVASKKRAEYRRRYELLDSLQATLLHHLTH